jgi:rhamnosyl/mannosyltransferase
VRVTHVTRDAHPPTHGGIEHHVWDVARALSGEFDTRILTSSGSRRRVVDDVEGIRVVRAREWGRVLSTPVTPSWWGELRDGDGVVHVHLPCPLAEMALVFGRAGGSPAVVAGFHAEAARHPLVARGYRRVQERFLQRAARIVVSSPAMARSPALARHRDRVVVVPFGVDADRWAEAPDPPPSPAPGGAGGRPLVVFLGRLVWYKGVEVLVEAMRAVDADLVVVGDGPRRASLVAAARAAGLDGRRARFVGAVADEERAGWLRAADVFVLPSVSRAEAFGIAMLEAMACGTPVVSTELGTGTSWVNRHCRTGLVVPPGDPSALATALNTLLGDDARRRAYGEAAAHRVRTQFSEKAMVDRLADVYRSVAGGPVIADSMPRRAQNRVVRARLGGSKPACTR